GWEGSPRKFTQPTTRTIPLAQDSGLPFVIGEGRLRARTPASLRHKTPYSASRCPWQKASVRSTIFSCAMRTAAEVVDPLPVVLVVIARPLVVVFFLVGCGFPSCIGSDVTMPNRSLASL